MIVALVLSTIAVVTRLRPRACSAANAGSSLAAAAFLMLAATAVLHTAGSLLRLVAAYVIGLVQTIGSVVTDAVQTPHYMQLPQPANFTEALRMDLMPASRYWFSSSFSCGGHRSPGSGSRPSLR
jgi:uncharacterized membrane protein YgcG